MAGAGYKLFNTGDVLTAAQVNEYLMQQTVMVFADASARTTALSGVLAEGMLSYLKSDDKTYAYNGTSWVQVGGSSPLTTKGDLYTYSTADARLAVGANDTVLTADSSTATGLKWAAVSADSITLINETVASALSSLSFSSIPSTYQHLLLVYVGLATSDNSQFNIRFNNDSASNYEFMSLTGSATTYPVVNHNDLTYAQYLQMLNNTPATAIKDCGNGILRIDNYASTTKAKPYTVTSSYIKSGDTWYMETSMGAYNSTSAITSIDIVRTGGTGTFSNISNTSLRLYGVK